MRAAEKACAKACLALLGTKRIVGHLRLHTASKEKSTGWMKHLTPVPVWRNIVQNTFANAKQGGRLKLV